MKFILMINLFIFIMVNLLLDNSVLAKPKIFIKKGIVITEYNFLLKFLPEFKKIKLLHYTNFYSDPLLLNDSENSDNPSLGIRIDLNKDNNEEYFILGHYQDMMKKWKTFILILSYKDKRFKRKKVFKFKFNNILMGLKKCKKQFYKYCKNENTIYVGWPFSEAIGFIYWNSKRKMYKFKAISHDPDSDL